MDAMMAIHEDAINSNVDKYHQFLSDFKRNEKMLYGFVEGGDDKSFYYALFKRVIPSDWDMRLYDAGCKENVLNIYECFDWSEYDKTRIVFLIDRDLDNILSIKVMRRINIYVTDEYSIENTLIEKKAFRSLLECNCKIPGAKHSEYDAVADIFEKEAGCFIDSVRPVMNWIIYNRFRSYKSQYKKIEMKHIFSFSNGRLLVNKRPKNYPNIFGYIRNTCSGKFSYRDIEGMKFIRNIDYSRKIIRGKYLLWFFVNFYNHIVKYADGYFQSVNGPISKRAELNLQNVIELTVLYIDTPKTFIAFAKKSVIKCIRNFG